MTSDAIHSLAPISAVVITLNEEQNIQACLAGLSWVEEIIVVDAESTDQTVEIARNLAHTVCVHPWSGYGPQKNFGIDRARANWILIVDADERVTLQLRDEIIQLKLETIGGEVGAFEIPRRNFFYGRWIQGAGMFPDVQLRLFRRRGSRYDSTALHERLQVSGKIRRLHHPLDHLSMPSISIHVKKMIRYTTLGAEEKLKSQSRVTWLQLAGNHIGTFLKTYLLRGGFRDGLHGLVVSIFAAMHTFVKYVKVWEKVQFRESHDGK